MKVAVRALSALAAVAILAGSLGSPSLAAGKKKAEPTIFDWIDSDLRAIDKAITDLFKPAK
jgi:hypothetical protein